VVNVWSTLPASTTVTTIASGKSDDPIKLGDGLKYLELTERVEKLDTSVAEMKEMLQQLLTVQKVQSTVVPHQAPAPPQAPAADEIWNLFQPFLQQQKQMADQQHAIHVQELRNTMESRFKNTQADIKAIKAYILNTTGTALLTILFIDQLPPDNAKKGEKIQEWKKKGIDDGLYIEPEKDAMTRKIPLPDGSKKVDVTQNALDEAVASVKRDRAAKDMSRWNEEKRAYMELNAQGCSEPEDVQNPVPKRNPTRKLREPKSIPSRLTKHTPKPPSKSPQHQTSTQTVVVTPAVSTTVDTSVVSTTVSQTPAITSTRTTSTHTTTTALPPSPSKITSPPKTTSPPSPPAKKQKTSDVTTSVVMTTVVETPVVSTAISQPPSTTQITTTDPPKTSSASLTIKRRRIFIPDDDSPSPPPTSSQSLSLVTIPNPVPLSSAQILKPIAPAGVKFPLKLIAVREEIKSFYYEDDPAKRSLPSVEGYPRPNNIEEYLKVKAKQAEDISKRDAQGKTDKEIQRHYQFLLTQVRSLEQFAKNVCQQISEKADESLRKDYVDNIMAYKKYKGEKYMYEDWTIPELESEAARIQEMIKNKVKHTPPDWSKYKKNMPDKTLELKIMKEELVAADYGSKNQVMRWREDRVRATYKRLEELRKKDPKVPQKPDYSKAVVSTRPPKLQVKRATAPAGAAIYKRRDQNQLDTETVTELMAGDELVKEGIKVMIAETLGLNQPASTAQTVITRPASLNTSSNKNLPRNPPYSKVLKWKTDKQTHVLTVFKSSGEVKKITMEQALGLSLEDLQDLLDLPLCRDDDDTDALAFE